MPDQSGDVSDDGFAEADDDLTDPPIASFAAIGDCRTLALVSRQGSVDWLCLPSIASPSVFAALLDRQRGGRFALRPVETFRTERRYLDGTNILETMFITKGGRARVLDSMSINGADGSTLQPERELLRVAEGIEGQIRFEVIYDPRPDYARVVPRLRQRGALGWFFEHHGQGYLLEAELDLHPVRDGNGLHGAFVLRPGERLRFAFLHAMHNMMVIPALGQAADLRLDITASWWRNWSAQYRQHHRDRPAVLRSVLALKLLTYSLSGAVVAAGTTSLPEALAAGRNYDYRFCWLRDSETMLRAFFALGFVAEGRAYLAWLLHSTRLTRPRLLVLYDVHGRQGRAGTLPHLCGYGESVPVRIGNDAATQLQLDAYGSTIAACAAYVEGGHRLRRDEKRLLIGYGRVVCREWREKDSGLWEIPGATRHYVHSKLLCWSALDVLLRLHAEGHLDGPEDLFRRERAALRDAIETHGIDAGTGAYVGAFGENWADASLLVMARLGFHPPDDKRIVATFERIWRELGRDGLLLRYAPGVDGLDSTEGAFGICLFWAAELLALQGRIEEARQVFDRGVSLANDVGLLAEEFDPQSRAALGNFPQAFSHAGLISAALAVARAEDEDEDGAAI